MKVVFAILFALTLMGGFGAHLVATAQTERVERLCRVIMATSGRFAIHRAPLPTWPVLEWMMTEQEAVLAIYERECIP